MVGVRTSPERHAERSTGLDVGQCEGSQILGPYAASHRVWAAQRVV